MYRFPSRRNTFSFRTLYSKYLKVTAFRFAIAVWSLSMV